MFLPALWLFAVFVNGLWAGALGAAWIGARAWYAAAYVRDAGRRGPPFLVSTLVFCALTLGAAWGVVRSLLES
jgi:thiol:disulfide interchange protein